MISFSYISESIISGASGSNMRSSLNDNSFDWNSNSNDMSMSSMNDFDDYDPKARKYSDDDLRPQPVLRKSKKVAYISNLFFINLF